MRRVEDVLDVWFDSGSMSFAQVHYPFENADWFEHHFPGDFIVEYIGQTRGWFYTLHILATALFDRPAFQSCDQPRDRPRLRRAEDEQVAAELPRRARGVRPRRRRRHALVPDVQPDPARRQPRRHRAGDPRRRAPGAHPALERLVVLRALRQRRARGGGGLLGEVVDQSTDVLDRYILAKLREFVADMTEQLDATRSPTRATRCGPSSTSSPTGTSVARGTASGGGESERSLAAFDTLWTVLDTVTQATAPLLPLMTEEIWRGLTEAVGTPDRLPDRRGSCRPTTSSCSRWTGPVTSAQSAHLRKAGGRGHGCRSVRSQWSCPSPDKLEPSGRSSKTSST